MAINPTSEASEGGDEQIPVEVTGKELETAKSSAFDRFVEELAQHSFVDPLMVSEIAREVKRRYGDSSHAPTRSTIAAAVAD
jgi:hypothetical protein